MSVFKICGRTQTLVRSVGVEHFAGSCSVHGRYTLRTKEQKNNNGLLS